MIRYSAKHLRARDRALNHHVYPRIHYPEVYILKGGYSAYFTRSALFAEPRAYVRMDDPQFARDRRQDLDAFRVKSRFGRTRSYAYGELGVSVKANAASISSITSLVGAGKEKEREGHREEKTKATKFNPYSHQKRNTAPTAASMLLPPAELTRTRRAGSASAGSTLASSRSSSSAHAHAHAGLGLGVPSAFASLRLAAVPDSDSEPLTLPQHHQHQPSADVDADIGEATDNEDEEGEADESYLEQKHGAGLPGLPSFNFKSSSSSNLLASMGDDSEDHCVNISMAMVMSSDGMDHEHDQVGMDGLGDHEVEIEAEADSSFCLDSDGLEVDRSPCPPPLSSRVGNTSALGRFGMGVLGGKIGAKLDFGLSAAAAGARKPLQRAKTFTLIQ